jgi:hypothetical protein
MSTFHICNTMPEAEARKSALERSGYFVKIVKRDEKFHVDASLTAGRLEPKPKKFKRHYKEWEPTKEELTKLETEI